MQPSQSPLPEDPEFWDSLAEKVRLDAEGPLAAYAGESDSSVRAPSAGWLGLLSQQAPWLIAASVLVMAGLLMTLPESQTASVADSGFESGSMNESQGLFERSLSPYEPAGELIARQSPPSVGELFVALSPAAPLAPVAPRVFVPVVEVEQP